MRADGSVERVTVVKAGTFFDGQSALAKLSSGQTDKSQKVSLGSLNQETSGSNALSLAEAIVGTAVCAAVRPQAGGFKRSATRVAIFPVSRRGPCNLTASRFPFALRSA